MSVSVKRVRIASRVLFRRRFGEEFDFLDASEVTDVSREKREAIRDRSRRDEDIRHLHPRVSSGEERGESGGASIDAEYVQRRDEEENGIFFRSGDARETEQLVFGDDREDDLARPMPGGIEERGDTRHSVEMFDDNVGIDEHAHTSLAALRPETLLFTPPSTITRRTDALQPMEIFTQRSFPLEETAGAFDGECDETPLHGERFPRVLW